MIEQTTKLSKAAVRLESHRAVTNKLFAFGVAMCCAITILVIPSYTFGQALQSHKQRSSTKRVSSESAAKPSFENDLAAVEEGTSKLS